MQYLRPCQPFFELSDIRIQIDGFALSYNNVGFFESRLFAFHITGFGKTAFVLSGNNHGPYIFNVYPVEIFHRCFDFQFVCLACNTEGKSPALFLKGVSLFREYGLISISLSFMFNSLNNFF